MTDPVTTYRAADVGGDAAAGRALIAKVSSASVNTEMRAMGIMPPLESQAIRSALARSQLRIDFADALAGKRNFAGLRQRFQSEQSGTAPKGPDLIGLYLPHLKDEGQWCKAKADGTLQPLLARAREHFDYEEHVTRAAKCESRKAQTAYAWAAAAKLDRWNGDGYPPVRVTLDERGTITGLPDYHFDFNAAKDAIRGRALDLDKLDKIEEQTQEAMARAQDSLRAQVSRCVRSGWWPR